MSESDQEMRHGRTEESAPIKTVGIVGHGNFGGLVEVLARRFAPEINVRIFSLDAKPDEKRFFSLEDAASADAVVLAVPIGAMEGALIRILPSLKPGSTLIDVATVKEYSAGLIREIAPGHRFVSVHPMFGPESYKKRGGDVAGFKVVLTDTNLLQPEVKKFRSFLEQCGASVLEMTAEEHDGLLAETLFLTHLIGQLVSRGGFKRTPIDTPSFGWLMDAVESVKNDSALFKDVFRYNRFCKQVLERFGMAEEQVYKLFFTPEENTKS